MKFEVVDDAINVEDTDAFGIARRLACEEGILCGGSAGANVWAALEIAKKATKPTTIVTVLPYGGYKYLSKIFNDEWMYEYGFLEPPSNEPAISDILAHKLAHRAQQPSGPPDLVHIHPDETVGAAIGYLREYNVSQMPVVRHEPPLRAAEVAGSVIERQLLAAVFADRSVLDDPVSEHMSPPLPTVGTGEPLGRIVAVLGDDAAVLVHDEGNPVGILTRADLLSFLAVG